MKLTQKALKMAVLLHPAPQKTDDGKHRHCYFMYSHSSYDGKDPAVICSLCSYMPPSGTVARIVIRELGATVRYKWVLVP